MPNQFDTHLAAHYARLRQAAGRAITYRRNGDSVAISAAVRAKSTFEVDDGSGMLVELEVTDFLIAATDLVISAARVDPQEGDLIEEIDGLGRTVTYKVLSPGGDEPAWRYSDPQRSELRIHTKMIDEVLP